MSDRMDGYVRVSRVAGREGPSFISPDEQRDQIQRWAGLRHVEIAQWHTDLDVTGGKLERPGLDQLMARIRTGQTAGLVVARLDRLSRAGVADALRLVEEIHQAGASIAALDLGIDPTTPFGEFATTIMLALGRMERRRVAENWLIARRRAVERGVHISSRTPTGYTREEHGQLVPHARDAPVIRELFERKAAGASWGDLARLLNDRRVEGPYRAVQWTQRAMSHILTNRVYLGEARSGDFVNVGAHTPLVTRETFEAAQRAPQAAVARSGEPALLSGLLRCAGCRHLMKPDHQRMRDGTRARIYRCRGIHSSGTCQSRAAVLGSVIEPYVEEWALEALGEQEARQAETSTELHGFEAAARDAEDALAAYRDDERVLAALGPDRYVEGLRVRAERVDEAHARLADARAQASPTSLGPVAAVRDLWPDLEVREKQKVLRAVIDTVFLGSVGQANVPIAERTVVFARGTAPPDLPRRGKRFPLAPFPIMDHLPTGAGMPVGEDLEEDELER